MNCFQLNFKGLILFEHKPLTLETKMLFLSHFCRSKGLYKFLMEKKNVYCGNNWDSSSHLFPIGKVSVSQDHLRYIKKKKLSTITKIICRLVSRKQQYNVIIDRFQQFISCIPQLINMYHCHIHSEILTFTKDNDGYMMSLGWSGF